MEGDLLTDMMDEMPIIDETKQTTEATQTENIQQTEETKVETKVEGSSLNTEKTTETTEVSTSTETVQQAELNNETVAKWLSERHGSDVNIDEALTAYNGRNVSHFASDELEAVNRYVKETGRSAQDYYKTQTIDLEKTDTSELIKAKMAEDYPMLNAAEINSRYESKYGKESLIKIDEDSMEDSEIAEAKIHNAKVERQNSSVDIDLKIDRQAAHTHFESVKEQYRQPAKKDEPSFDVEGFRQNARNDFNQLKSLEFGEGDDKFTYDITDKQRADAQVVTPEEFMADFVKEDGTLDVTKWNEMTFSRNNIQSVLKAASTRGSSSGRETLERELKNTDLGEHKQLEQDAIDDGTKGSAEIMDQLYGDGNMF